MTEPPNTEAGALRCPVCEGIDWPGLSHNPAAPYCSQAEPPNTEALLATVREALTSARANLFPDPEWNERVDFALAALDAIASELERLTACEADQRRGASYEKDRADTALARLHAAEAELGRVRERAARLVDENIIESGRADVAEAELRRVRAERDELWKVNQTLASDHYFARAEKSDARLDRALEALREIENWPHGHTRRIARAALAEIEESG